MWRELCLPPAKTRRRNFDGTPAPVTFLNRPSCEAKTGRNGNDLSHITCTTASRPLPDGKTNAFLADAHRLTLIIRGKAGGVFGRSASATGDPRFTDEDEGAGLGLPGARKRGLGATSPAVHA
jgi:hypothetical protein